MPAIKSVAKQVKQVLDEQSQLLKRLRKLAPKDYEQRAAAMDGTAMTWRSTLNRMDDARECLDDLEATVRYAELDAADAAATTEEPAAAESKNTTAAKGKRRQSRAASTANASEIDS